MANCRSLSSLPAGCAMRSACGFTSRWINLWISRCRPAPAPPVQLYNSDGPFARTFAGLQIHLVSWLHYVY